MAMVPAKSHQQLHNFSLSFLKWGQRSHVNTSNRCRRLISDNTTTTTASRRRLSPRPGSRDSSDSDHNNNNRPSCSRNRMTKDRERKVDDGNDGLLLERETNSGKLSEAAAAAAAAADGEGKPWNLRPRRSAISAVHNHTVSGGGVVPAASSTKSGRLLRGAAPAATAEENEVEERKKRKLWISLSKEEIEEDVYALTRSKPARRPKKRNKTVQRYVDNLFPGLYMIGISADSYRV